MDFLLDDDAPATSKPQNLLAWKILIVDDEPEVHKVTRMVLESIRYRDRPITLLNAYSAREAVEVAKQHSDIAIILLDVIMETDDAGLRFVRQLREELGNHLTRVVLRTGQPGQAPEREVVLAYDINDYKAKTELTSQKLFTTTIAALRAFEHIQSLEINRQGMENIVEAGDALLKLRSLQQFASEVLNQVSTLIATENHGFICMSDGQSNSLRALTGTGSYAQVHQGKLKNKLNKRTWDRVQTTIANQAHHFAEDHITLFIASQHQRRFVVFVETERALCETSQNLAKVLAQKLAVGLDNLHLYDQLNMAMQATVVALADIAEYKDTDTGGHVLRVADMTDAIARILAKDSPYKALVNEEFVELVGMASILHDVGKVSIPDKILLKPGSFEPQEKIFMKTHAQKGEILLEKASSLIEGMSYLSLGAEIAGGHHERFDGKGYPRGLAGQDIPLSARIVSVSDVFDALISKRPYKDPWPMDKAVRHIVENAGSQFDPVVVKAFLKVVRDRGLLASKFANH